jgi:GT2 family glycosyltransferase
MDLSIVIVSYNTKDILENCLRSIYAETKRVMFEVIVVDNASEDGTIGMIDAQYPNVRLIKNSHNAGFAAANNQGITISLGKYVLLLNSDTVVINGALDRTIAFMDTNSEASITGCRQLFPDFRLQESCRSFPTPWNIFTESTFLYKIFPKTRLFGHYYLTYFDYRSVKEIDVVMGSFMMIRRSVLNSIGGFDESFFFYTEETDFCYRAKLRGFRSFFYPDAEIIHIGGGSTKNLLWTFRQLHISQYQYIDKHYRGIRNVFMRAMKRFGIWIRIPVYFITGLLRSNEHSLEKAKVHWKLSFLNFRKRG